jgi:hypothetical protein
MPETAPEITGEEIEIRPLSPPDFVKALNARDERPRRTAELQHFLGYLRSTAGLLREMPEDKIEALIGDYLDETGAENG